jgi:hypothetical protein
MRRVTVRQMSYVETGRFDQRKSTVDNRVGRISFDEHQSNCIDKDFRLFDTSFCLVCSPTEIAIEKQTAHQQDTNQRSISR